MKGGSRWESVSNPRVDGDLDHGVAVKVVRDRFWVSFDQQNHQDLTVNQICWAEISE